MPAAHSRPSCGCGAGRGRWELGGRAAAAARAGRAGCGSPRTPSRARRRALPATAQSAQRSGQCPGCCPRPESTPRWRLERTPQRPRPSADRGSVARRRLAGRAQLGLRPPAASRRGAVDGGPNRTPPSRPRSRVAARLPPATPASTSARARRRKRGFGRCESATTRACRAQSTQPGAGGGLLPPASLAFPLRPGTQLRP